MMCKEEYLKSYKEEKLAEICEELEISKVKLINELNGKIHEISELQKELRIYKEQFSNINRLFDMLKNIPTKDFIELYYNMGQLLDMNNYYYKTISKD